MALLTTVDVTTSGILAQRLLAAGDPTSESYWHAHATDLITRPAQTVAIIVVALLLRFVGHRAINRLTRSSAEGKVPRILSPLTERVANSSLRDSAILLSQRRKQRAETIGSVLKSVVSVIILVTAFFLILQVFDINLAPFVAGTSIIGVAVGFGAQSIVKDFLSGMFMMLEDQYGVGDVVDLGDATGTIESVGLRTTRMRDMDGTVWYIRNGEIARVGNMSQNYAQTVLDIPVGVEDDVRTAGELMLATANEMWAEDEWADVFLDEPELLGVQSVDRFQTVIRLVIRVRSMEQWRVGRELRGRIRTRFNAAGIGRRPAIDAMLRDANGAG